MVFGLGLVVATLTACGSDGMHDTTGAAPSERTSVVTTTAPAPASPRTPPTVPESVPSDIAEVPRPANVADDAMQWFARVPGSPNPVLLGVRRSASPRPHPALLVVDASGGLNPDYVAFAEEFVARGFDVAVGCLFSADATVAPQVPLIACPDAPALMGVVDAAVPDLDRIVDAAYDVLGASTPLGIIGFSRGAGIAALRATSGGREPVILVSGKYEGWSTLGAVPGGEVNILDRVAGWRPPALVLHGTADGAIPVSQAHDFEAALLAAGASVEARYYEGSGHNLAGEPEVHADLEGRISAFLCAHMVCAA
jgi:dienelactone hydrolase